MTSSSGRLVFANLSTLSSWRWLGRWRGEGIAPIRARWQDRAHPRGTALVARLSDGYISETTGSLPQNVNFALRDAELAVFLRGNGLFPSDRGLPAFDMDDGAPSEIADIVVPIVCD